MTVQISNDLEALFFPSSHFYKFLCGHSWYDYKNMNILILLQVNITLNALNYFLKVIREIRAYCVTGRTCAIIRKISKQFTVFSIPKY